MKRLLYLLLMVPDTLFSLATAAQAPCDSLIIHSVGYDAFHSDELLEVVVQNPSTAFFPYPAFALLDANGDSLASEDVNFFGIGDYYQGHTLELHEPLSDHQLNGAQLVLTGMNEQVYCIWEEDYDLCPDDACRDLRIVMQGANFPSEAHTYTYDILDSTGTILAHDTMHIDSAEYTARDTVCLFPGNYSIVWERVSSASIEALHFRVDMFYTYTGPLDNSSAETVTIPFEVMAACLEADTSDSTIGIGDPVVAQSFSFGCNDQCILLQNNGSNRILGVQVYDLHGRMVHRSTSSGNFQKIPVPHNGIYVVHVHTEQGIEAHKVLKY